MKRRDRQTDGRTDGRQTVTLRFSLDAVSVITVLLVQQKNVEMTRQQLPLPLAADFKVRYHRVRSRAMFEGPCGLAVSALICRYCTALRCFGRTLTRFNAVVVAVDVRRRFAIHRRRRRRHTLPFLGHARLESLTTGCPGRKCTSWSIHVPRYFPPFSLTYQADFRANGGVGLGR